MSQTAKLEPLFCIEKGCTQTVENYALSYFCTEHGGPAYECEGRPNCGNVVLRRGEICENCSELEHYFDWRG